METYGEIPEIYRNAGKKTEDVDATKLQDVGGTTVLLSLDGLEEINWATEATRLVVSQAMTDLVMWDIYFGTAVINLHSLVQLHEPSPIIK